MQAEPSFPEPLRTYHPTGCNEPILLYSGPGLVTFANGAGYEGEPIDIGVQWLPRPSVRVRLQAPVPHIRWTDEHVAVALPVVGREGGTPLIFKAQMVRSSGYGDPLGVFADFVAAEPIVVSRREPVGADWVQLHLVNCLDFIGQEVTQELCDGSSSVGGGRMRIENRAWVAVLDPAHNAQRQLTEAMRQAGYTVSHTVRLEARRTTLSPEKAQTFARELSHFLSIMTASTVGAFLLTGFDSADTEVWSVWDGPEVDPYKGDLSALPRAYSLPDSYVRLPDLSAMSDRYVALNGEAQPAEVLRRLREWYIAASHADSYATRSVFAGAGLELLTYWHLVTESGLSLNGFDKMNSADRLRLLLSNCKVPFDVPEGLRALAAHAAERKRKGQQDIDGPWMVADFRNGVVHPPTRANRTHVEDTQLLYEASVLGLWYLELATLRLFNYEGAYRVRVVHRHPGRVVPWAQERAGESTDET